MRKSLSERISFAKIVVVLAVAFFIGVGLCGLDSTVLARFRNLHEEFGPNTFVGVVGAWVLLLSGLGLVCAVIAWVLTAAVGGLRGKEAEPQKLFDDEDETRHDDDEARHDDPR